jgi:AcrR family transcriptional regulator
MSERVAQNNADTKTRILDAGERLFAELGFAGASLRAVTVAAGTNVASVNYHFGSKEGLLRAVVRRAMASVNEDRRRLLDEMGPAASAEEIVRVFIRTGMNLVERLGERGDQVARFIGRVICDPSPVMRELFAEEVSGVEGRYLSALRDALPDLSPDEVAFRFTSMIGLVGLYQSGAFVGIQPDVPQDPHGDAERLIAFVTAGLLAPPRHGHSPANDTSAASVRSRNSATSSSARPAGS